MSTQISYLKGIRTRYRNFLEKEIAIASDILHYDPDQIDVDRVLIEITKCVEKMKMYSEKVEIQTEKLSCALDETESDYLDTILGQDSQICADAMECCIDLKQMKETLIESKEKETVTSKLATKSDAEKLADMQNGHIYSNEAATGTS